MAIEALDRPPPATPVPPAITWQEAVRLASFQDLLRTKRKVLAPLLIVSLVAFLTVMLLAGFARDLMIVKVGPLGLGYVLIIGLYLMCWGLGLLYVRSAERDFDPRAAQARRDRRAA